MRFIPTPLADAYVVELEPRVDERGFFARVFCREEFEAQGLDPVVAQVNLSSSPTRGTLRGLHYQLEPMAEAKLVRCVRGAIFDVIVDARPHSTAYLQRLRGRADGRDSPRALHSARICARLSDIGAGHRRALPRQRALFARARAGLAV